MFSQQWLAVLCILLKLNVRFSNGKINVIKVADFKAI